MRKVLLVLVSVLACVPMSDVRATTAGIGVLAGNGSVSPPFGYDGDRTYGIGFTVVGAAATGLPSAPGVANLLTCRFDGWSSSPEVGRSGRGDGQVVCDGGFHLDCPVQFTRSSLDSSENTLNVYTPGLPGCTAVTSGGYEYGIQLSAQFVLAMTSTQSFLAGGSFYLIRG